MTKKLSLLLTTPLLLLAGCGDDPAPPGDDQVTETQMDEVEVIDGTISDDMVDLDSSAEVDAADVAEASGTEATSEEETSTGDAAATAEEEG